MKHTREYFDSDEEFIFYCWLLEAQKVGVVKDFQIKPYSIEIFKPVTYTWEKTTISKVKKIKKTKEVEGELLKGWTYTPDFIVYGDLSQFHTGTHKIVKHINGYYIIDTKGTGANFKDSSKFPLIQKALYHSKGIYVNKIVPEYFCKNAWLPMPVLKQDDKVWTNYQVLKNGRIKDQKKRSAFKDCKTFKEKIELKGSKGGFLHLFQK